MEKIRIVFVISTVDFSYGLKWLAQHMPVELYDVTFVFLYHKSPALHEFLIENKIRSHHLFYKDKYDLPKTIRKLITLFKEIKPQIVHTHLFEASLAGLVAAKLTGVPVRIHTRHHASIHHDHYPRAVWADRLVNRLSHRIVSISKNVHHILIDLDKVDARKIIMVHHGFDFKEFSVSENEIGLLKDKYSLQNVYPVVGVVSRFTSFKGVQFIIPAFKKLLLEFPEAVLVLANAIGDYSTELEKLLAEIPSKNYRLIEFEQNVFTLYKCFDVFVHVPVNEHVEAFGQIYVEAMALDIPVICTLSGIATEYIVDGENAITVPFRNSEKIYDSLKLILSDKMLSAKLTTKAKSDVSHLFDIKQMIMKLDLIYRQVLAERV